MGTNAVEAAFGSTAIWPPTIRCLRRRPPTSSDSIWIVV